MTNPMTKLSKQQRAAIFASASTSSVLLASRPSPVLAQTADPVAQMTAGVNSLAGIAAVAAPIAIGVTIFAVAALLVKRFLYS